MMFAGLFFLLLLGEVESSEENCSYMDVLNYLNLTKNKEQFSMIRPVRDYRKKTHINVQVLVFAILDVKETDQIFIPYVWMYLTWDNEYIKWKSKDFCGIDSITVPADLLWKPDIIVEEMTEKDKVSLSPYVTLNSVGTVNYKNDHVLICTCRMHIYKFPFDVQNCTITLKSVAYTDSELKLIPEGDPLDVFDWSNELMKTQYEWLFTNLNITTAIDETTQQEKVIYTISMKRKPILYIVNFLLPVFFMLCLDLSSFLISDSGGEKLSFKITVMLAITVMQLLLHEVLPASSNRIPLIAVYCIGIFGLMLLSLLETIVMMYLLEKDEASHVKETNSNQPLSEDCEDKPGNTNFTSNGGGGKKWFQTPCLCDVSACTTPTTPLKGSCSQLTEEPDGAEKPSEETMKELVKTLILLVNDKKEDGKPGYWAKKTQIINKVFFIFYVTASTLFLVTMYFFWNYT